MDSETRLSNELAEKEHKIDRVVRLFAEVREDLQSFVRDYPDATITMIPKELAERLRAALGLYDEVNAFLARIKNV